MSGSKYQKGELSRRLFLAGAAAYTATACTKEDQVLSGPVPPPAIEPETARGTTVDERFVDRTTGEYNLVVPANQQVEIPAVEHFFDNVIINEGGTLLVSRESENWTLIECRRDFTLLGAIISRNFTSDAGEFQIEVAGKTYSHKYRFDRVGGAGGNSGFGYDWQRHYGAAGSSAAGGGGAAAYMRGRASDRDYPGVNGNGWQGGVTSFSSGGNGGRRVLHSNGGLLFLNIGHEFVIGPNNLVDLRGETGTAGAAGTAGQSTSAYFIGGSGGGGGSPGGEGGVLYHRVGGNYSGSVLKTLVTGGDGGAGGIGGAYPLPHPAQRSWDGQPGGVGQQGRTGLVRAIRD